MELIGSLECEIEIVCNWMQPWRCWLRTQKRVHAGSSMAYRIGLSFGICVLKLNSMIASALNRSMSL